MNHRMLHTDKLRSAAYDDAQRRLEIVFNTGQVRTYKGVPAEVARRFFSSPNPASFWEDRIAEEYPFETARGTGDGSARSRLDGLFGGD